MRPTIAARSERSRCQGAAGTLRPDGTRASYTYRCRAWLFLVSLESFWAQITQRYSILTTDLVGILDRHVAAHLP